MILISLSITNNSEKSRWSSEQSNLHFTQASFQECQLTIRLDTVDINFKAHPSSLDNETCQSVKRGTVLKPVSAHHKLCLLIKGVLISLSTDRVKS